MKVKILAVVFGLTIFGLGVAIGLTLRVDEKNDRIIIENEEYLEGDIVAEIKESKQVKKLFLYFL